MESQAPGPGRKPLEHAADRRDIAGQQFGESNLWRSVGDTSVGETQEVEHDVLRTGWADAAPG